MSNVYKSQPPSFRKDMAQPHFFLFPRSRFAKLACACTCEASSIKRSTMQKVEDALPGSVVISDRLSWMIRMSDCCILQFV